MPARSAPSASAPCIVFKIPNIRNATMIEAIVRLVRTGFLRRLAKNSGRNFNIGAPSSRLGLARELPFRQVQRMRRARRGVRIVRDHDDGLAVPLVERLQKIQNLVAGLAVEVARGLVAEQ